MIDRIIGQLEFIRDQEDKPEIQTKLQSICNILQEFVQDDTQINRYKILCLRSAVVRNIVENYQKDDQLYVKGIVGSCKIKFYITDVYEQATHLDRNKTIDDVKLNSKLLCVLPHNISYRGCRGDKCRKSISRYNPTSTKWCTDCYGEMDRMSNIINIVKPEIEIKDIPYSKIISLKYINKN